MKGLAVFIFLIVSACKIFAQTAVGPIAPPTTTVRPTTVNSAPRSAPNNNNPFLHRPSDNKGMLATNTIIDNIAKMDTLSRFLKAVQAAGLVETFRSAGPITVFIPSDEAFKKMTKGKLDTLLMPGNKYNLIAFVTYHAIPGKITLRNITRQAIKHKNNVVFTTLAGGKLTARLDAGHNIILVDENGGESTIIQSDMQQSNGLIFVVNRVLVPKTRLF